MFEWAPPIRCFYPFRIYPKSIEDMASSRRTYDTDVITLRTVFAKDVVNSNIPALRVLTADGAGGTYWAIPSSLGQNPAFNEIITSGGTYTADLSYNRFRLLAGEGIGMVNGAAGSNQTTIYGKAFTNVDVSGENAFYAFANNTLNPSIRVATTGAIQARSDPATNTLFIDGPVSNPYIVSTGQYGFYQLKVTQEASSITSSLQGWTGDFITANSPSTLLRFIGYNDIHLSTNVTTNSVFFTISTFTSKGYLDISANAYGAYPSSLSTVSSLYTPYSVFASTITSLSSIGGFSFSSVVSSINALAMSTGEQFYTLTGLINARVTFDQEKFDLTSTVAGLGSAGYLSTGGGAVVGIDQFNSTIEGLGSLGFLSSVSTLETSSIFNTGAISTYSLEVFGPATLTASGSTILRGAIYLAGPTYIEGAVTTSENIGLVTTISLFSTIDNLGTYGYISTASLVSTVQGISLNSGSLTSTVEGLGSSDYISTASLVSTVQGISLNSGSLTSTVEGLGSSDYISTASLVSTIAGLGSSDYISTASLVSTVQGISLNSGSLTSTVEGLGSIGYISTASLVSTVEGISLNSGSLTSTVEGLGSSDYVSTASLVSTVAGINLNPGSLTSTVEGLGSSDYISTLSLVSSIVGLGSVNYVSSASLASTFAGIGISTGSLFSTVRGLGSANYVSTASLTSTFAGIGISTGSLVSTVTGLGSANYVSTASLTSTFAGIGISTGSLFSTVRGLGSANYVSTASLTSTFAGIGISTGSLFSTVTGLGSANYVSTLSLTSTVRNLQANPGFPSTVSSIYGSSFTTQFLVASTMYSVDVYRASTLTFATGDQRVVYSSDGIVWQPTNFSAGVNAGSIRFNGDYWLLAGGPSVYISYDGINWSVRAASVYSQTFNALAWGNGIWVGGGINSPADSNTLKYSFDGITWYNGTNGFNNTCLGLAFNGYMFIAVGHATNTIKYSYDGKNWTNATGNIVGSYGQAIGWNGQLWIAGGQPGGNNIKYSLDGINWSNTNGGFPIGCYAVAWNGNYWVAGGHGGNTLKYSFDGINWIDSTLGAFTTNCVGLSWNGKVWNALGQGGGTIKWSADGAIWANAVGAVPLTNGARAHYNPGPMSYSQGNLDILPDTAPLYLNSTNQIFMTTSTINFNNTLRVDARGFVGVMCNSPNVTLDVNGVIKASTIIVGTLSSFSTIGSFANPSSVRLALLQGNAYKPTGSLWDIFSDQRLKDNIVDADLEWCYSDIKNVRLRRFQYISTYIEQAQIQDTRVLGFVAQEVSSIIPKAVNSGSGYGFNDLLSLNVDQLNMSLFGAVKKTIHDKELMNSTIQGQRIEIETLKGTQTYILSTLEGLQGR